MTSKSSHIETPIIPHKQSFYRKDSMKACEWSFGSDELDIEAICEFVAIGFFLDDSTFYKNTKVLPAAASYDLDGDSILNLKSRWQWSHQPRQINLKQAVEEFAQVFEKASLEDVKGKRVILPISGGLDSRSQAVALRNHQNVSSYSYQFDSGFEETGIAAEIAEKLDYPFKSYYIKSGYLWDVIEDLADTNLCFSDFTHPRQMAVKQEIGALGDVFHLGHWGDVLFDDMGVSDDLPFEQRVDSIIKKITKKSGLELANALWQAHGHIGNFETKIREKVASLMAGIKIESANAHIRAFKSTYWAPRWTSINMSVFESEKPLTIPYYKDEVCRFISEMPEELLAQRKIQIEYMKTVAPEVAKVTWQDYRPFNLYNYKRRNSKAYLPVRAVKKARRLFNEKVMGQKMVTQRNWELQFLGEENRKKLESYLLHSASLNQLVPVELVKDFYQKFNSGDRVLYSHPVSMMLTLSLFSKRHFKE